MMIVVEGIDAGEGVGGGGGGVRGVSKARWSYR